MATQSGAAAGSLPMTKDEATTASHLAIPSGIMAATMLALVLSWIVSTVTGPREVDASGIKLINPPRWFQLRLHKKRDFLMRGRQVLERGRAENPGRPFRVINDYDDDMIVLPPWSVQHLRNNPSFNFPIAISTRLFGHLPGFEPFAIVAHSNQILQKVVRKHLAKLRVTDALCSEATFAVSKELGDSAEWRDIEIGPTILSVLSRLSSRVFVGAERCRDDEWLDMVRNYTVVSFRATFKFHTMPAFLVPLFMAVDSDCRRARSYVRRARAAVKVILNERHQAAQKRVADGLAPLPPYDDAVEWSETEAAGTDYDPGSLQLLLSFLAIHTTTSFVATTLLQLAKNPEVCNALRREMVEVLRAEGWRKKALFKMQLLDSTIKEAARLNPFDFLAMSRLALEDVTLPGGVFVAKGQRIAIDVTSASSVAAAAAPSSPEDLAHDQFDPYRFMRLRGVAEHEHRAQFTTSLPDQLVFGYGKYACPGRFFAGDQIKLTLCHLLLKYDWALPEGAPSEPIYLGSNAMVKPGSRVLLRRRKEEINLESLEVEDAELGGVV